MEFSRNRVLSAKAPGRKVNAIVILNTNNQNKKNRAYNLRPRAFALNQEERIKRKSAFIEPHRVLSAKAQGRKVNAIVILNTNNQNKKNRAYNLRPRAFALHFFRL